MASCAALLLIVLIQLRVIMIGECYKMMPSIGKPRFPAILVFGDSTIDPGNINFINKPLIKCNHLPYGRDFPGHTPTGRCSNGRLVPDMIAFALRIKDSVPPYLDPDLSDDELRTGVSFAFGGSGYDDLTSAISGTVSVLKQFEYFKEYVGKLKRIEGEEGAEKIIKDSLVIVSAGTNDFAINFYDIPARRLHFNISGYQDFLQRKQKNPRISYVYGEGCRNIVVAGLPPIGCLPIQMTANLEVKPKDRKCVKEQNSDSKDYNKKLAKLLAVQQTVLPKSNIIYFDVYDLLKNMIHHPKDYGIAEIRRGCCGTGYVEAGPFCNGLTPTCHDSSKFLFWDAIHPTESAYLHFSNHLHKQVLSLPAQPLFTTSSSL